MTVVYMPSGEGFIMKMDREFKYTLAEAMVAPNGSGMYRTGNAMRRLHESDEEKARRVEAIRKSDEDRARAGVVDL